MEIKVNDAQWRGLSQSEIVWRGFMKISTSLCSKVVSTWRDFRIGKAAISSVLLAITAAMPVHAAIVSSVTFTDTQPTPGTYQYDLTVNNIGATTIGTFWFSWIPGAGFMSVPPTNVQSPTNWTEILTNAGKAIQWKTTTLLAPGASESGFMFDSTLSPAALAAEFTGPGVGTGDPIATYFVYIAAPLADPGFQGVATPATAAPEPATLWLLGIGIAVCSIRRGRQGARMSG